jgi:DNA invertase Pin-like site-specific DNA recombinase
MKFAISYIRFTEFDKKGIQLVAIAASFDMTNPHGRALAQMASVLAELQRAMIRERRSNNPRAACQIASVTSVGSASVMDRT